MHPSDPLGFTVTLNKSEPLRARVPLKVSESIRRVRNTMTKRITLPYFVSSRINDPSNPIVTASGSELHMTTTLICLYGGHRDCRGKDCTCKCHKNPKS